MGSTNATSVICPIGSFCPVASKIPTPCTGGSYCDRTGLDVPTFECKEGYYCTLEASQANPTDGVTGNICPKGNYCPRGSKTPKQCPIGTYLNTTENVYVLSLLLKIPFNCSSNIIFICLYYRTILRFDFHIHL